MLINVGSMLENIFLSLLFEHFTDFLASKKYCGMFHMHVSFESVCQLQEKCKIEMLVHSIELYYCKNTVMYQILCVQVFRE